MIARDADVIEFLPSGQLIGRENEDGRGTYHSSVSGSLLGLEIHGFLLSTFGADLLGSRELCKSKEKLSARDSEGKKFR